MPYVDGFVIPMPRKNLAAYKKMARAACRVWMEHGALDYRECLEDDVDVTFGTPFPKMAGRKKGEVVIFSWITYKSRAHRDMVNKKVMADPRISGMMAPKKCPFDMRRMACGGFKVIVEATRA